MTSQDWWIGDQNLRNIDPHSLNIIPPRPVPALDQITLKINIGCTSRVRLDEAFQPTKTYTIPFLYVTTLQDYTNLLPTVANEVWNWVLSEKQQYIVVETHVGLWLDNVTHPWPAAGVVKLPKAHRDTQLSNEDFTSSQVLLDHLTGNILDLRNTAKY